MNHNKILIVDDAGFARKLIKRFLKGINVTNVVEAKNAAEAKTLFEQENPDLTLLDISLPDSHDLTLLQSLIAINPDAKIIMCSALGQDKIMMDAIAIGAIDFVSKPFTESELLNVITKHLSEERD